MAATGRVDFQDAVAVAVGATVLAWTAAKMMIREPMIKEAISQNDYIIWGFTRC